MARRRPKPKKKPTKEEDVGTFILKIGADTRAFSESIRAVAAEVDKMLTDLERRTARLVGKVKAKR